MGPHHLTEDARALLAQHFHILLKVFENTEVFSDEVELAHLSRNFIPLLPEGLQAETLTQIEALLQPKQRTLFQRIFFPKTAPLKESLLHALRKAYLATLYPEFQTQIMAQPLEFPVEPLEFTESFETALLQIAAGRNIEAKKGSSWFFNTPLSWATENGHESIVKLLLESGADMKAGTSFIYTALMVAAENENENIVKLLLESGADVNAKDKHSDDTALMRAARNGRESIVKLLLENGADMNAKSTYSETALICAARSGHESIVKLLLEKGADINEKDNGGDTALICAARNEKKQVVSFLLPQQTRAGLPQANLGQPGELMAFFENDIGLRRLIRKKGGREQVQVVDNALAQADTHEQNVHAWYDAACAHHNFSALKNFYSDKSPKALEAAYEAFVTAMRNMTHAFQTDPSLLKRCFSGTQVKLGAAHLARKGTEALARLASLEMPKEWFKYTAPTGEEVKSVLQDLPLKTALAYLWLAIQDTAFLKSQLPALSDKTSGKILSKTLESTTQNAIEGLAQALVLAQMEYGENRQACAKGLTSKVFHLLEGFASGASVETDVTADLTHLTTRTDWILQEQKRLAKQGELDPASMTALMPEMSTFILSHTVQHHPLLLPMLAELLVNKTLYAEIMDPDTSGKSMQIEWEENGKSFTETAHDWQIRQYILGLGKQYFESHYAKHFAGALQVIPVPRRKDFLLFEQHFGLQAPLAEADLPTTTIEIQQAINEKTTQLNQAETDSPAFYQVQVEIAYLKALHARQAQTEQNQVNIKLNTLKRAKTSLQTEIKNLENELPTLAAGSSEIADAHKKLSDLRNQHSELIRRIQAAEAPPAAETGIAEAGSASSTLFSSSGTGKGEPTRVETRPENEAASRRLSSL